MNDVREVLDHYIPGWEAMSVHDLVVAARRVPLPLRQRIAQMAVDAQRKNAPPPKSAKARKAAATPQE